MEVVEEGEEGLVEGYFSEVRKDNTRLHVFCRGGFWDDCVCGAGREGGRGRGASHIPYAHAFLCVGAMRCFFFTFSPSGVVPVQIVRK